MVAVPRPGHHGEGPHSALQTSSVSASMSGHLEMVPDESLGRINPFVSSVNGVLLCAIK